MVSDVGTIIGLHNKIEYSFIIVGHTKFSCDRCFGILKQKTNKTPLWTLYDIATTINEFGNCNHVELVGEADGTINVQCYDWIEFFEKLYTKVPNITAYHHFNFPCASMVDKLLSTVAMESEIGVKSSVLLTVVDVDCVGSCTDTSSVRRTLAGRTSKGFFGALKVSHRIALCYFIMLEWNKRL